MVALISDTLKHERIRMKKYFEELVIHVRTNIVGTDGEVDIPVALVGVMLPFIGIMTCYLLMAFTPDSLGQPSLLLDLLSPLRWIAGFAMLLIAVIFIAMLAATVTAVHREKQ